MLLHNLLYDPFWENMKKGREMHIAIGVSYRPKAHRHASEEMNDTLTCNRYGLISLLPTSQENDVLLRDIDIVILQKEHFVDAIVL